MKKILIAVAVIVAFLFAMAYVAIHFGAGVY